jgi:allophanate hydrolase subunit 2
VAVAGGIRVAPVLGSRSTDTLSGLGPPPMRAGFVLPVGSPRLPLEAAAVTGPAPVGVATEITVRLRMGPRQDWFSVPARDALLGQPFTLTAKSNRVAARLAGPPLTRATPGELPSEGIVLGAVQVPADGQPLIFLADHPTTGGYPVIAVIERADLPLIAQARPGTVIRFVRPGGVVPSIASGPWT